MHLGPPGRQGGRCLILVLVLARVLFSLVLSLEAPTWPVWAKLAGRRARRKEAWSVERHVFLRAVDRYSMLATGRRARVQEEADSAGKTT